MQSKNKVLIKIIAAAMALAVTTGTGIMASAVDTAELGALSSSASGDSSELGGISGDIVVPNRYTWGDFDYTIKDDGTIALIRYQGSQTNLTVPNKIDGKPVTEIMWSTFYKYTKMTGITIPDSVTSISLLGCSGLKSITIPDSVTTLAYSAFEGCTGLTEISIPDSVKEIKDSAFRGCTGLTSIVIPNGVTKISSAAFYDCTNLKSVTLPDTITAIENNAFNNCQSLTDITLPESVSEIGFWAFYGCESLTNTEIPKNVTNLNTAAFSGCTNLKNIHVASENTVYSSENGVLFNKAKTELKAYPQGKTGNYVIPSSVKKLESKVFENCKGLTGISVPNTVTEIPYNGFRNCTSLKSVNLPNTITTILSGAFDNCINLKTVTIPNSVTKIAGNAFSNTGLTSVAIPSSVTSLGADVFSGCENLKNINTDAQNPNYVSENGVLFDKTKKTLVMYPAGRKGNYTIPNSVTSIRTCAFCGDTGLTGITIPDSVMYIGENAFKGCTGLTDVTVPDSVVRIYKSAFEKCTGLTTVSLPSKMTFIDERVFFGCTSLKNIVIPNNVIRINFAAFYGCTSLTDVTLPDNLQVLDNSSFYGCTGLKSMTIPKKVTKIGWAAFSHCTNLTNISIPSSVKEIEKYAFENCDNLTIYGQNGSYTETYADENNIPFVSNLVNHSEITANTITLGGTVDIKASALGGNGSYTYAVLYKKKSDTKWTVKQNYSTNSTISVKPAKATDYDICVKVKDSDGTIVKKFFTVKVNAKLANTSTISSTTIKHGNTVTVNGSATGGTGNYTYAVLYKKKSETAWTVRQGYKDNASVLVRPYKATDYDICIKVKDDSGTISKKYFSVTVK